MTFLSRDPFPESGALVLVFKPEAGRSDPLIDSGGGGSGSPVVDLGSSGYSWSLYEWSSEIITDSLREGSRFSLFLVAALPRLLNRLVGRPDFELLCNFFVTRTLSCLG